MLDELLLERLREIDELILDIDDEILLEMLREGELDEKDGMIDNEEEILLEIDDGLNEIGDIIELLIGEDT